MSERSVRHATKQDRVPRLYKEAKKIVQKVKEEGGSFKGLVYGPKGPKSKVGQGRLKALYALVSETLRHGSELDAILRGSQLLIKEPRLDAWLARVLITQLLWREQPLSSPALPFKIILSYESELRALQEKLSSTVSESVTKKRPRYVRINTIKTSEHEVVDFFVQDGWKEVSANSKTNYAKFLQKVSSLSDRDFIRDMHIPNLLIFPGNMKFYDLKYYRDNFFILQDKASCMSAFLLDPKPGSTVLDMCAAPGMKTTHAAAMLNNTGTVYAIEKHPDRYASLCKVVSHSGATCVKTILGNALDFTGSLLPDVEYILVDPSCSGSGMTDRQDIFKEFNDISKPRLEKLAGFQSHILRHAMTNFPNAKRIVYSTCSMCPEENEEVIQSVLNTTQNFKPILPNAGAQWMHKGSTSYTWGEFGFYARPEVDLTSGFFVAVFERTENEYVPGKNSEQKVYCADTQDHKQKDHKPFQTSKKTDQSKDIKKSKKSKSMKKAENSVPPKPIALMRMMKAMSSVNQSCEAADTPVQHQNSYDNVLPHSTASAPVETKSSKSIDDSTMPQKKKKLIDIQNNDEPVKKKKKRTKSIQ